MFKFWCICAALWSSRSVKRRQDLSDVFKLLWILIFCTYWGPNRGTLPLPHWMKWGTPWMKQGYVVTIPFVRSIMPLILTSEAFTCDRKYDFPSLRLYKYVDAKISNMIIRAKNWIWVSKHAIFSVLTLRVLNLGDKLYCNFWEKLLIFLPQLCIKEGSFFQWIYWEIFVWNTLHYVLKVPTCWPEYCHIGSLTALAHTVFHWFYWLLVRFLSQTHNFSYAQYWNN